ncbi:MAG: hypothetical protein HUU18_07970 [Phycisphaerales bacterium]|nr:hypothetical protein [Phycisphaerales bacterium]
MKKNVASLAALVAVAGLGVSYHAAAQSIEVIYTKIPGHPTAVVPGALDLSSQPMFTEWRAFEDMTVSPDGSKWVLKSRSQAGSDLETILIMGSGTSGTMFAQEGQPVHGGVTGELYDFFGSGLGRFNSNNEFAYSARARGGVASVFQKVIHWNGSSFSIRLQMGDLITGLADAPPNPSGDERFGNSVGSVHILDNGTIGTQDSTITSIHTSRRPAIMYNNAGFHQANVTSITAIGGVGTELWKSISANSFYTSPNGLHWVAEGTINQATTIDAVLVYNDRVVLQEGSIAGDPGVLISAINASGVTPDGSWYARGIQPDGSDWAIIDGDVVAATGQPITPGSTELWGDTFLAFHVTTGGGWVLVGNTNNADTGRDTVIVRNGDTVIVREGDQVDLDGDGTLDDAYLGRGTTTLTAFDANDVAITPDGFVYFIASIHNEAGVDYQSNPSFGTPHAFFRFNPNPACLADFNNSGGTPDDADVAAFFEAWNNGEERADVNGSGGTPDDADVTYFFERWNAGC